ncbi:MAG TPA: hypothetical protein VNX66_04040 [Candidatus Sulfotelmatobacter sp.]|jgi:hypothetical protein|nr:hypothetical protein [Candidatus Sulfotelmatobacter sp.]
MEFKFEEFTFIDPKLSAEEQAEVKAGMLKVMTGAKQQLIGDKRREMAENFVNMLEPERKKKLEEEISALHTTKDEARFRVQVLLLLSEAFVGGVAYGQSVLKKDTPKNP